MGKKSFQADQLIPTSSTPPPEAGFYRIDRQTIGVVGNMSFRDPNTQAMMPVGKGAIPFPDFAPRLLASLVASSTAACTSGVVTVTATAHGIPTAIMEGYQFYYPGSPSLAAGWYSGLSRTSADAVTFSAPGAADFTSESVNGGAAFVDEITFTSMVIPANAMSVGSFIEIPIFRQSNGTAGTKTTNAKINGNVFATNANTSTTAIIGTSTFCGFVESPTVAVGHNSVSGVLTSGLRKAAIDIRADQTLIVSGQLSAASLILAMHIPHVRII